MGSAEQDRVPETQRLWLIEEHEIRRFDFLVEVGHALRAFSLLLEEFQESRIRGKVVLDRSLAPPDDDVEVSDYGGVQLLDNRLVEWFELDGVVRRMGDGMY